MNTSVREYTLAELARLCGATLHGDGSVIIRGVAPINSAERTHITFIESRKFLPSDLSLIKAGAIVTHPSLAGKLNAFSLLLSPTPKVTFARISQLFHKTVTTFPTGIHPLTWIDPEAKLEQPVNIGPFVTIGARSFVGKGSVIIGNCYVGNDVIIGEECILYPGVVILDKCRIGKRVIIHSGTVIGSDGFGYAQDEGGEHVKIPQLGSVVIEDDVEIGANCTIDRATFGETTIKRGSKIDNLVTIAHNVTVGERCILAGQVGIAGSSTVGDGVIMGGQVGVSDHVTIGNGVKIGAKSGVSSDVKDYLNIVGLPALPREEFFRILMQVRRLDRLKKKVENLENTLRKLLSGLES